MGRIERVVLESGWPLRRTTRESSRTSSFTKILRECRLKQIFTKSIQRQLDGRRCAQGASVICAGLGRFDPGKYLRGPLHHLG